jgi:hypothetical protein
MARELRVDHFVAAIRLTLDEVGEPAPAGFDEARLVDDPGDPRDRVRRRPRRNLKIPVVRDGHDLAAIGDQRCQIGRLVLVTLPLDQVGLSVEVRRPLELASRDGQLGVRCTRLRNAFRSEGDKGSSPFAVASRKYLR